MGTRVLYFYVFARSSKIEFEDPHRLLWPGWQCTGHGGRLVRGGGAFFYERQHPAIQGHTAHEEKSVPRGASRAYVPVP